MTTHKAKVSWLSEAFGGRKALPPVGQYITLSRFSADTSWPDGAWSVVLEFEPPASVQGSPSRATVRFLVEAAPVERLMPGAIFELYEGLQKVATVEVID